MKERPILFSGEMVRAILEGRKTQTRRVLKLPKHGRLHNDMDWVKSIYQDGGGNWVAWDNDKPGLAEFTKKAYPNGEGFKCPYGVAGDHLWVRESWASNNPILDNKYSYCADSKAPRIRKWKPSIHMPRGASRINLEIVGVRVERVQDISEKDAEAEGVDFIPSAPAALNHRTAFKGLWDKINAPRGYGWDKNPYVWVIEFKRVTK